MLTEWTFFTELAVQTVFIALLPIATQLFEELDDRLEKLNGNAHIWNIWKRHYDLVRRFVDLINAVFGHILVYILAHIITDMIFFAIHFMGTAKSPHSLTGFLNLNHNLLYFSQIFLRLLLITSYSCNMTNQVSN